MESLPDEILVKVLQMVGFPDLKNCSLLNSRFYELICSNSSLNNRFKLNLRDLKLKTKHTDLEIISTLRSCDRKFRHCYLSCAANTKKMAVMKKVGVHIKYLEILIFRLNLTFFLDVFKLTPNINSLKIFSNLSDIEPDNRVFLVDEKIPKLPKLKYLSLKGVVPHRQAQRFLELFSGITTLESVTSPGFQGLVSNILGNQPNLEELNTNLASFFEAPLPICNFSLKKFIYDSKSQLSRDERSNLASFFNNQPEIRCLRLILCISSWSEIMQSIVGLRNLIDMDINLKNLDSTLSENLYIQNDSLKTLTLNCNHIAAISKILHLFPKINKLDLYIVGRRQNYPAELFEMNLEHFEYLESIKCTFSLDSFKACIAFRFKKLTKLKLVNVEEVSPEEWIAFFTNNPNILSIELMRCQVNNEIILIMAKTLKKLQKLVSIQGSVNRPKIDPETLKVLCESCPNLKEIQLALCDEESDFNELHEYLTLKGVKVTLIFRKVTNEINM